MTAKASMGARKAAKTAPWDVPAKSPDLDPVETFWPWLRKKINSSDHEGLRKKRRRSRRTARAARAKKVLRSVKAQTAAKNVAGRFRAPCKEVVDRDGAVDQS